MSYLIARSNYVRPRVQASIWLSTQAYGSNKRMFWIGFNQEQLDSINVNARLIPIINNIIQLKMNVSPTPRQTNLKKNCVIPFIRRSGMRILSALTDSQWENYVHYCDLKNLWLKGGQFGRIVNVITAKSKIFAWGNDEMHQNFGTRGRIEP